MTNAELLTKIKAEIESLKGRLIRGACAAQIEMETNCKEEAYDEVLSFLSTLESEKSRQDGLKEEIESYWKENGPMSHAEYDRLAKCARHFVKWQKEQMMKEAVNADVMLTLHDKTGDISLHTGYLPKKLGIKCDDKVRIIIVKED